MRMKITFPTVSDNKTAMHFDTKAVHSKPEGLNFSQAVNTPIFQSSTYEYGEKAEYDSIKYARLNNTPNHDVLHHLLTTLEEAESALVTSSGMSAISTTLLGLLSQGDHILVQSCIYGGTYGFITQDLPRFGITFDFFDAANVDTLKAKIKKNTKAIYLESISNPMMRLPDFSSLVDFAKKNALMTLIDNTYTTPYNFKPSLAGIDISLHSATKQLNGHSDIIAGAIIGKKDYLKPIGKMLNKLGGCLDTHACYLLERGLKTLGLRVRQQNQSALAIAEFLKEHPAVLNVNYPGLKSHPEHELAKKLFAGFGGMLSFRLKGGISAAEKFVKNVKLALHAPSSGGVESLITLPAYTTHAFMSAESRNEIGITDDLIRLSVGLEDESDLLADIKNALEKK